MHRCVWFSESQIYKYKKKAFFVYIVTNAGIVLVVTDKIGNPYKNNPAKFQSQLFTV